MMLAACNVDIRVITVNASTDVEVVTELHA
jgi:hypothetical protein